MDSTCILDATCHVWTAGSLLSTPWSGLVPLAFFVCIAVNVYLMMGVGAARKKYGIPYPSCYAVPGTPRNYGPKDRETSAEPAVPSHGELITNEEAFAFNCVQRAHMNTLENLPIMMLCALVSWPFPIPSGFALISYALGRIVYARGYAAGPAKRISVLGSLLTYPAMITLLVLPIITAAFLFNKTAPYKYK